MPKNLLDLIRRFPLSSGVYLMKNAEGRVIYVGKAVSLRKRVGSYFRKTGMDSKTARLVRDIADIEYILTGGEAEALILEASLIKKYQPHYNIDLRDDKSYPYIEITGEEFPSIAVVRPREKDPRSQYFGPYVEPRLIREALTFIRKIFPFCICRPLPKKPCLDYHLGLCNAPCVGAVSRQDYRRNIRHIAQILEGKKDDLYRELKLEMESLARKKNFEAAARVRDQLRAIGALYSGTKDENYFKEAEQLQRALGLARLPERIEAIDISHIMGQQSVGALVSFLNGRPDKNNYRRFRIKSIDGIDDFAMIGEVVTRRYQRLKSEGLPFPDLVLIDGGKGQLAAAAEALQKIEISIPLMALAKREEEIFVLGKRNPIVLDKESLGLHLLQRLRDEAHRFAVAYHRKLRIKNFIEKS